MKLIIEDQINTISEIYQVETILEVADFDVGLRQMLEAAESATTIMTDNVTLTDSSLVIQALDAGGSARDITLPAESVDNHGFLIFNVGDELLTVKTSAGVEKAKVYPGGAGWFVSLKNVWVSAGSGTTNIQSQRIIHWRIIPKDDAVTVGDEKDTFTVPEELVGYNLLKADASVNDPSTNGVPTFQIHNATDGVDMLSTRITIDINEKTSYTAATRSVVDTTHDDVAAGDELRADVDVAGTGTKGAIIIMVFQEA